MCNECECPGNLMRTNVGDARLREKGRLLIVGSCMYDRFPDIIRELSKNGEDSVLHVCLEEMHINQVGFKIASIVRYSKISDLTILTADGSPHCVQLHYVIEDIKRHFTPELIIKHYVVEKGNLIEIGPDAVKRSRHLSKIEKMLEGK